MDKKNNNAASSKAGNESHSEYGLANHCGNYFTPDVWQCDLLIASPSTFAKSASGFIFNSLAALSPSVTPNKGEEG